ncbi:MAG: hypothetical protein APR63_04305 [Desulfuromonas sp. SDB]|nr:MAG: hypothetical protein APR63_04305 [Desulfuromonas sp. SDB]
MTSKINVNHIDLIFSNTIWQFLELYYKIKAMEIAKVKQIVNKFNSKQVMVIGDIMLDEYIWGKVERISPEAPVPVVDVIKQSFHLGGAGNVAHNLRAMNAQVSLIGVLGNDLAGEQTLEKLRNIGISEQGIFIDANRTTTQKTRIIAHSQHVVRVDREKRSTVAESVQKKILNYLNKSIHHIDGLIFEDYNKGLLSKDLISEILNIAQNRDIPTFVDPKFENFFSFQNVTCFKPNLKELAQATGISTDNRSQVIKACHQVIGKLNCKYLLLTLGEKGMLVFTPDRKDPIEVPTKANQVYDVSGAGDTVISAFSMSFISGADILESAVIASHAAAVQVGKIGAQTVIIDEIIDNFHHDLNY